MKMILTNSFLSIGSKPKKPYGDWLYETALKRYGCTAFVS